MRNKTALIITFTTLFLVFFVPLRDTDFGWHYQCGQMLIREGKLCSVNSFTTLLNGYHWYSPSQGYQIVLYLTFKIFGFLGITFFYALSAATIFTLFIKLLKGNTYFNLILFTALMWLSWGIVGLGFRSQIVTLYFFAIFLALIEMGEKNFRYLLLLIPLMTIWSNSHSGFFLGNILTLLLATRFAVYYLKKSISKDLMVRVLIIVIFSNLATLINPYGLRIYQEVLQHTKVPLNTLIAEWVPPNPVQVFIVTAASLVILTLLIIVKSYDPVRLVILIITAIFSLEARRNLPLFSIAFIYALSDKNLQNITTRIFNKITLPETIIAFLIIIFVSTVPNNLPSSLHFREIEYCQKALAALPCKAVDFLKTQNPGHIFNTYEWGGYLIWKLPNFKIFVDGRMPSWNTTYEMKLPEAWRGKSPYTIYLETLQNKPGWEEVLKAYQTNYVLIQPGTFMDLFLKPNPQKYGFTESYRDGTAVVYLKII